MTIEPTTTTDLAMALVAIADDDDVGGQDVPYIVTVRPTTISLSEACLRIRRAEELHAFNLEIADGLITFCTFEFDEIFRLLGMPLQSTARNVTQSLDDFCLGEAQRLSWLDIKQREFEISFYVPELQDKIRRQPGLDEDLPRRQDLIDRPQKAEPMPEWPKGQALIEERHLVDIYSRHSDNHHLRGSLLTVASGDPRYLPPGMSETDALDMIRRELGLFVDIHTSDQARQAIVQRYGYGFWSTAADLLALTPSERATRISAITAPERRNVEYAVSELAAFRAAYSVSK